MLRKVLGGIVVLGLGIAIPATFSAPWFVTMLWIVVALAAVGWMIVSAPIKERFPYRLLRKDPEADAAIVQAVRLSLFRSDLQTALHTLSESLENPSPAELRAFADNVARRVRNEGFEDKAKKLEVVLPDNAPPADVVARRSDVHTQLIRMLIWDEFF